MRLDNNYRKKSVRNTNTWRLNNTLLNDQEITEGIKEEIKKYLETNDNENMMTQNLWDAAKAVLRRKFIAIQAYLKKQETSEINNLTLHLSNYRKNKTTPNLAEGKKSQDRVPEGGQLNRERSLICRYPCRYSAEY